jgi:hypothetical protein
MPIDLRQPAPNWWREAVGQDAANMSMQQGVFVQYSGPLRGNYCDVNLEIKSARTDWTFGPLPQENVLRGFPSYDDLDPALERFKEVVLPWANGRDGIRRMAFGAVLAIPVADRIAGYRAIQPLLPSLNLDIEHSSDLFYQINRHVVSAAASRLHINRLSNWGVVLGTMQQVRIGPVGTPVLVTPGEGGFTAVRLQLDINTDAERTEVIPSGTIRPLVEELIGFGKTIADRGDVA